ncbi:MAG: hypothetical protein JW775_01365 [Candidatus Aminicenantes bacterium]|nr:hypothetical protein [Candidatus Aminicenantes bacterium]
MRLPKILTRIGVVLLIVAAGVMLARAVLNTTEGRRLARTLAGLKAEGIPLTVEDLLDPCPDEKNGASLWKAAEELYAFKGEDIKLLNEVYQRFVRGHPVETEDWASLGRLIEKNRRVLDLIPEIAGRSCFQYGALDARSWERKIPDAIKLIRTVRLWGFESLRIAENGDVRGALDRLRTGLRFASRCAEEPSLITYLIALANMKTCLLFLNESLSGREAGGELLLPLLGELDEGLIERRQALLKGGIQAERVLFLDIGLSTGAKDWASSSWLKGKADKLSYWLIRPLIKRDVERNITIYAEVESKTATPYSRMRDFWKQYKKRLGDLPWYAVVSKIAIPEMEATFMKGATFDALVRTARAGLACRIHKDRTGSYPEALAALVPELLDEVPTDPFTGEPLVYRAEGEGFIVYSLGSNLRDDGGRSTWEITQLVMDKDDDWAWKEDR